MIRDSVCGLLAYGGWKIETTQQERFDHLDLLRSDVLDADEGYLGVLARVPKRLRLFWCAIVHDDSAGDIIAQTFVLRAEKHAQDTHGVNTRKHIYRSQQIASNCFFGGDFAPGIAYHTNSGLPLARSLTLPKRFENGEVSPIEKKERENIEGNRPLAHLRRQAGTCPKEDHEDEQQHECDELNQCIDEQRHEAAADAGERELELHLFGSVDDKLVEILGHDFYVLAGKAKTILGRAGKASGPVRCLGNRSPQPSRAAQS